MGFAWCSFHDYTVVMAFWRGKPQQKMPFSSYHKRILSTCIVLLMLTLSPCWGHVVRFLHCRVMSFIFSFHNVLFKRKTLCTVDIQGKRVTFTSLRTMCPYKLIRIFCMRINLFAPVICLLIQPFLTVWTLGIYFIFWVNPIWFYQS